MIDRRTLIGASAGLTLAGTLPALAGEPPEIVPLWPRGTPDGQPPRVTETIVARSSKPGDIAYTHITRPRLIHTPPTGRPNGAALLLIPGGGYVRVAVEADGGSIARAFAGMGYDCYTLLYRLPGDGWTAGPDAPLQDAQRALRLIAARRGPEAAGRIGVLGASAGGHLAARLATRTDLATYPAIDDADRIPLGLRVAALLYPVVSMEGPFVHKTSREQLLGASPAPSRARAVAADAVIAPGTPPAFITHAIDDRVVPVENGLAMLAALRRAGVPVEAHFPERGGHGFGLEIAGAKADWPQQFPRWAAGHGLT